MRSYSLLNVVLLPCWVVARLAVGSQSGHVESYKDPNVSTWLSAFPMSNATAPLWTTNLNASGVVDVAVLGSQCMDLVLALQQVSGGEAVIGLSGRDGAVLWNATSPVDGATSLQASSTECSVIVRSPSMAGRVGVSMYLP